MRVGVVEEQVACEIGAGLWVARQLSTRVELISSSDGLTVRLSA